jgi:hypothetical protein
MMLWCFKAAINFDVFNLPSEFTLGIFRSIFAQAQNLRTSALSIRFVCGRCSTFHRFVIKTK